MTLALNNFMLNMDNEDDDQSKEETKPGAKVRMDK